LRDDSPCLSRVLNWGCGFGHRNSALTEYAATESNGSNRQFTRSRNDHKADHIVACDYLHTWPANFTSARRDLLSDEIAILKFGHQVQNGRAIQTGF
jgi:hypothetical protein